MLWFDYCNDSPGATIISNGMVLDGANQFRCRFSLWLSYLSIPQRNHGIHSEIDSPRLSTISRYLLGTYGAAPQLEEGGNAW